MKYPARVKIVDVSPRDGLQNERGVGANRSQGSNWSTA